jgi:hypothetical protein
MTGCSYKILITFVCSVYCSNVSATIAEARAPTARLSFCLYYWSEKYK